jgi:hypothetical protein
MTMLRFRMDFNRSIPACFGFLFPTAMEMTSISCSSIRASGSCERMTSRSETSVLSNRQTCRVTRREEAREFSGGRLGRLGH